MAKKAVKSHMSEVTKAKNAGLLAIAFVPRIEDTVKLAKGELSSTGYIENLVNDYTGYDIVSKNFDAQRLARGYGPILGAVVLGKAIGYMRKRFRV